MNVHFTQALGQALGDLARPASEKGLPLALTLESIHLRLRIKDMNNDQLAGLGESSLIGIQKALCKQQLLLVL